MQRRPVFHHHHQTTLQPHKHTRTSSVFRALLAGIVLGITVGLALRYLSGSELCHIDEDFTFTNEEKLYDNEEELGEGHNGVNDLSTGVHGQRKEKKEREFMLVGIMTARKFLRTRAVAVYRTWAKTIPGRVIFFSCEGAEDEAVDLDIPVVGLKGVTDVYPPMSKAFMMLKYMYDNYLDKFEWFVRADDDVYIRTEELVSFLMGINSSAPQYIGQAGIGSVEDLGKLYFAEDDNFCMGGGGYIMSRETVRLMSPQISQCMQHLYSRHDDVEIGRCVKIHVGIPCTWALEMEQIFFQDYYDLTFAHPLNDPIMDIALTLHSIKNISYMYRMHSFYAAKAYSSVNHRLLLLRDEHRRTDLLISNPKISDERRLMLRVQSPYSGAKVHHLKEVIPWEFVGRRVYSVKNQLQIRGHDSRERNALDNILSHITLTLNQNASRTLITNHISNLIYATRRVEPTLGIDYIVQLEIMHEQFVEPKSNVWSLTSFRVRQPFAELEFRDVDMSSVEISRSQDKLAVDYYARGLSISKRTILLFSDMLRSSREALNFVVRLSGTFARFKAFVKSIEQAVTLETEVCVFVFVDNTSISIGNEVQQMLSLIKDYEENNTKFYFHVTTINDSVTVRDCASHVLSFIDSNALLVVVNEDIRFTSSGIKRLKTNTIQSRQVYFPIVFTPNWCQFDDYKCFSNVFTTSRQQINQAKGIWRNHDFGLFAIYASDMKSVNEVENKTSLHRAADGQLTLLEQILIHNNLMVFRAPDHGIFRAFVPHHLCKGDECKEIWTHLSITEMAERVYNITTILDGALEEE